MNPLVEMKTLNQWVNWKYEIRDGKKTKILLNPNTLQYADATDSKTWSDYETAKKAKKETDGIGFVFSSKDSSIMGIDLDNTKDNIEEYNDVIDYFDSYTEISPSGNGYHIYIKGKKTTTKCRKGNIEVYDNNRFFTVTGNSVRNVEIKECQEKLEKFEKKLFGEKDEFKRVSGQSLLLTDSNLLQKAFDSKNGEKLYKLYYGDTNNYNSQSEADFALASMLYFWTQNYQQLENLMRGSALNREKWNRKDYLPGIFDKIAETSRETYFGAKEEIEEQEKITDFKIIPFNQLPDDWKDEDWIIKEMFCRGGLFTFSAHNKDGKTIFFLCFYKALSEGVGEYVGRKITPTKILHISEEFEKQWAKKKKDFSYAKVDIAPGSFPKAKTVKEWEDNLKLVLDICKKENYEMVVFDTLDDFWPVGDENASEAGDAVNKLKILTKENICVVAVMHTGKSDKSVGKDTRGHSSVNDKADGIISFKRVDETDVTNNQRKIIVKNGRFYDEPYNLIVEFDNKKKEYIKIADNDIELEIKNNSDLVLQVLSIYEKDSLSITGIVEKMKKQDFVKIPGRKSITKTIDYLYKNKEVGRQSGKGGFYYWKLKNDWKEVK